MSRPSNDGSSGRRLVIGMIGLAVALAILAFFLRGPLPSQRPPSRVSGSQPAAP